MQASYWYGLATGVVVAAVAGAAATVYGYARFARLRDRARRAERLAELGTLTGGLAHEIRNPLSTIGLNLQLLREDLAAVPAVPPRSLRRLDTVAAEAARLRETLDDFLRYAGRLELDRRPTDLDRLLEELVDFLAPQAQLARVRLAVSLPPVPVVIPADANLLKQAVLNLTLNAIQAMPDGGDLSLSVSRRGRWATIVVADTGPGVPAADREAIFAAYHTRRKGGTGLGLAMTRRIAEEHGGTVAVADADADRGARFALRLPAGGKATAKARRREGGREEEGKEVRR